ncbi:hypothetical protein [Halomonas chromatireducens]|uniref:Uncharacterized protein n=1 Tax=Halomonas chromatireducens TaxID=507626 RepID=A0A0X8HBD3_9GAMM|nr:hypothetical protein [Halomonas chromatireducens]AMC99359.1 hypothetical protein LOKO_00263 [Halomonas chromatireducens]
MVAEKVVDEIFESVKPYVNLRRAAIFLLVILLASPSGRDLFFIEYRGLYLQEGVGLFVESVAKSRFDISFFAFFICFLMAPHLSHVLAMITFRINDRLSYIDDFFKECEGDIDLDFDVLNERRRRFVRMATIIKSSLESLCSLYFCGILFLILSDDVYWAIYAGAVISGGLIFLIYVECTSKVVRDYARSVYLIRLKSER